MLNQKSIKAIEGQIKGPFCYPAYGSYCFSHIPDTTLKLLNLPSREPLPQDTFVSGEYDDVILFFIDGFGWHFFEKYTEGHPFLDRFVKQGIVSKITSQFPSTTAAHATCINTGKSVAETGIYEWFQYEPELDQIIAPLLFSLAGDKETDTLKQKNVPPEKIYPFETFYQKLKAENVESHIYFLDSIVNSVYSMRMSDGAKRVGFSNVENGLEKLAKDLAKPAKEKRYFYFYIGDIDSVGHRHGTYSKEFSDSVREVFTLLENFMEKISVPNRKLAITATADHGMIDVDPKNTVYINERLPSILPLLKKNRMKKPLVPAGSCRDFFLHIEDQHLLEAKKMLEELLKQEARVLTTEALIQEGLFGTKNISKRLQDRIGNLVILPYEHQGVWWHEKPRFGQHFFAVHGGLSRLEMESIYLFCSL